MLHSNLQLWVKATKGPTKTYSFRRLARGGERGREGESGRERERAGGREGGRGILVADYAEIKF